MKTLEEIDEALIDIIWALLDYPELKTIGSKLHTIEKELDSQINIEAQISEAEIRYKG